MLVRRLREALLRINPGVPEEAIEEAVHKVRTLRSPVLIENNRQFHRMLTEGVNVSWREPDRGQHGKVWLLDIEHPEKNDWLAVNQFAVIKNNGSDGRTWCCLSMSYRWW